MGEYGVAEVCPNGHATTGNTARNPEFREVFCSTCGEKTLTACPECERPIRGHYIGGGPDFHAFKPPAHCHECGSALPWTDRKIQSAIELSVEVGGLTGDDAARIKQSIHDVVRDTPATPLAANRIAQFLKKNGKSLGVAMRELLIDCVSETGKKIMWPDR